MSKYSFVPANKSDLEAILELQKCDFEEVRPHVMELLSWCADANWPVAGPIFDYLEPYIELIEKELLQILSGEDEVWKYWLICMLIDSNGARPIPHQLASFLERIAYRPTLSELNEEVDEVAQACLEQFDMEMATAIRFDLTWAQDLDEIEKLNFWEMLEQLMQDQGLSKLVQKNYNRGVLRVKDSDLSLRNLKMAFHKTMLSLMESSMVHPLDFSTRYVEN